MVYTDIQPDILLLLVVRIACAPLFRVIAVYPLHREGIIMCPLVIDEFIKVFQED